MPPAIHIDAANPVPESTKAIKKPSFIHRIVSSVKARMEARKIVRSLKEVDAIRAGKKKGITLDEFLENL